MRIVKNLLLAVVASTLIIPTNLAFAKNNTVQAIHAYDKEKIMMKDTSNKILDLELTGKVKLSDDYKVFKFKNNTFTQLSLSDVLVGAENVIVYYNPSGLVNKIIIDGDTPTNNMRIGIMTNGFASLDHSVLDFESAAGFKIVDKIGNETITIAANAKVAVMNVDGKITVSVDGITALETSNRIYLMPNDTITDAGKIKINTFKRAYGYPSYRGLFEITLSANDSKLNLINEVDMENYLYQVVPSEMPASFGVEALKAQAVAARTYAMGDYLSNRYANKGFFVDDSTLSQVYNNSAENTLTTDAVNSTKGLIMMNNGSLVDARYYSTSGGFGAAKHEVWSDAGATTFPGTPIPYLIARSFTYDPSDTTNNTMLSLNNQDEASILAFYKDLSYTGYDSSSYYSRWKISLTKTQLENTVNKNILLRYAADPNFILTKEADGSFVSKAIPTNGVGNINNMYVSKRGSGGNAMELVIEGTTGTYKILKEFNIRFTIRPNKVDTGAATDLFAKRAKGGSTGYATPGYDAKNPSILFSAFFGIEFIKAENGLITDVTFYGGGNGHGVGMSQYGASALGLEKGWSYDKILNAYYANIDMVTIKTEMSAQTHPVELYAHFIKATIVDIVIEGKYNPGLMVVLINELEDAILLSNKVDVTNSELYKAINNINKAVDKFEKGNLLYRNGQLKNL